MSWLDFVHQHLGNMSRHARLAFAAKLSTRVHPIYAHGGDGCFDEVARAIELVWGAACGEPVDAKEVERHQEVIDKLVEAYGREEIKDLWATLYVVQQSLLAVTTNDDASRIAVENAAGVEPDVAQAVPFTTYDDREEADRHADLALTEEMDWQQRAVLMLSDWKGVAQRNMFDSVEPRTPLWFLEWKQATGYGA